MRGGFCSRSSGIAVGRLRRSQSTVRGVRLERARGTRLAEFRLIFVCRPQKWIRAAPYRPGRKHAGIGPAQAGRWNCGISGEPGGRVGPARRSLSILGTPSMLVRAGGYCHPLARFFAGALTSRAGFACFDARRALLGRGHALEALTQRVHEVDDLRRRFLLRRRRSLRPRSWRR